MKAKIDKKLLPMKAHYFLFNAGTAPVVPFMPTLARQLGFSSVVVGTMYTILPIVGMLAKPLFGGIADRYRKHKLLFLVFQILTAVAFFLIAFIPSIPQNSTVEFHCNKGESDFMYCLNNSQRIESLAQKLSQHNCNENIQCQLNCKSEPWMWDVVCKHWGVIECDSKGDTSKLQFPVFLKLDQIEVYGKCLYFLTHGKPLDGKNTTIFCPGGENESYFKTDCDITCNDDYIRDTFAESKIENKDVVGLYQFWLFFIFLIISWSGMAVVVSVGDAICFEMLGDRHYLYGNQRLWGAVGWGLFSITAGILVDKMSHGSVIKDYTVAFYMALIIIIFDAIVSTRLQHTQNKISTNILKDVGTIFLSLRVIIYVIWCIAVGLCTSLIWNFLFWYLEELGSADKSCDSKDFMKTLQGLAMGIQCFGGELPFFFLSGWILKKIGHINAMSLVLFGFGVRFILYSLLQNPWWVLPIELLNGITFGIFYSTMASYASIVAPPGTEATLQGLVGAIFEGVGVSIGSFIGGLMFKSCGGRDTFYYFGVFALCAFFVHVLVQWLMQKYGGKYGKNCITKGSGDGEIEENLEQSHEINSKPLESDKFSNFNIS